MPAPDRLPHRRVAIALHLASLPLLCDFLVAECVLAVRFDVVGLDLVLVRAMGASRC